MISTNSEDRKNILSIMTLKFFCIMLYLLATKLLQHIKMAWCFSRSKIQDRHTLSEIDILRVSALIGCFGVMGFMWGEDRYFSINVWILDVFPKDYIFVVYNLSLSPRGSRSVLCPTERYLFILCKLLMGVITVSDEKCWFLSPVDWF